MNNRDKPPTQRCLFDTQFAEKWLAANTQYDI